MKAGRTADNPSSGRGRRQRQLLAGLLLAAAALNLGLSRTPAGPPPDPPERPGDRAAYRPDGGQILGRTGPLAPNCLSALNLGRQVKLNFAAPGFLEALPGLGPQTARKARETGCLNARARRTLNGLVTEKCAPNNP